MKKSNIHLKNIISKLYEAVIHIKKINKTFKRAFQGGIMGGGGLIFSEMPLIYEYVYNISKNCGNRSINIIKKNLYVIFT